MAVKPIPEGYHTVIPHLVLDGAAQAIDFYVRAFGAEEVARHPMPNGDRLMHAAIRIGDSLIFLADDFPAFGPARNPKALGGSTTTIHLNVEDADAAWQRAVDAGATPKMPIAEMFWGDRYGSVTDPFGHDWSFSTRVRDVSPEELERAAAEMFQSGS